ncbi:MAG: mechanosensitive ion channel [Candidatus Altiarchaeales archaeon]|nr:mechanosensitive ion channel [Candidatus Altiarchaeales archaeon]MBD3416907.1 mechanosensitive ion channel [Candidatus Altiarchaeales archaeon]
MDALTVQIGEVTHTVEPGIVTAVGVFIVSLVLLRFFRNILLNRMEKISKKTKNDFDDLIIRLLKDIRMSFYLLASLFISLQFVDVPMFLNDAMKIGVLIAAIYYAIRSLQIVIEYFRDKVIEKRLKTDETEDVSFIKLIANIAKYSLWLVGFLLILANMNVDISALIAGMGIGGIAIALAAQNVLGDIFSAFSIYFDKPYKVGDFIIIGDDLGAVDKIGIKTTRIKTLRGEELVVSNQEMTSTRIHNFGKMPHRRIDFAFGVTYQTPAEKMKKIPGIVKDIIESQEMVRFDRAHFKKFGDFSLDFEVVYYVETADYNKYMDTQQAINLAIMEAFEKENIEFAYPTQTIFMEK